MDIQVSKLTPVTGKGNLKAFQEIKQAVLAAYQGAVANE